MNLNATIIGQSIAFLVFVWFCMKFIWPQILSALSERENQISAGLTAAEQGEKKLKDAEKRYTELVDAGKKESARIIGAAKQHAEKIVEEHRKIAEEEKIRIIESAQLEIDRERSQAKIELRGEMSDLIFLGVKQVLSREVNSKDHADVISRVTAQQ